jgi:hypothetical protein
MRVCVICGVAIEQVGAGRPRKTCGKKCKAKRDNQSKVRPPAEKRNCEICGAAYETRRKNQYTCSKPCSYERIKIKALENWLIAKESKPATKLVSCKWCEQPLEVSTSFQGVIKYHDYCKKPARQAQYRVKSIRRQGIKKGNVISHDKVAERDGHNCYLCEQKVDMSLPRTSRYGATLDHVIPLSKGGTDTMDNVKLTHWICNIQKSDKSLEEYRAESR